MAQAGRQPRLAQPPGRRSCREGGQWVTCTGANPTSELDAISSISRSKDDARLLRREIRTAMDLASQGHLTYGPTSDVFHSRRATLVLELRFDKRVQYPDGLRAIRLYFSEPDCLPGEMIATHMAAKPASKDGLALQNIHMDEAQFVVPHVKMLAKVGCVPHVVLLASCPR